MHYAWNYTANFHMKTKHSLDASDPRMYPPTNKKKNTKKKSMVPTFPCKVDNCEMAPCRSDKPTKFQSATAANKHMRKLKVAEALLYPAQDAPSAAAVQAEVTTPHIHCQSSISHSTSTHTQYKPINFTHTHHRKGKTSSAGNRQR